jgi:hypothetical protein
MSGIDAAVAGVIAALPATADRVEIVGDTELAAALRAELGERATPASDEAPSAVIETSGDLDSIVRALESVDDLGMVLLAGPPPAGPTPLDLYAHLHVRGLTLLGMPGLATPDPR